MCSAFFAVTTYASQPAWWTSRGAVNPMLGTNTYAVVTEGQLKRFTQKAVDELNTNLPGGAGVDLNAMVSNWVAEYATNGYNATNHPPVDTQVMTVGQIKYVGAKVWGQLLAAGYTNYPPSWLETNSGDGSMAIIGQLKTVFNFDLTYDSDTNSLPDWWEMYYFGQLGTIATNQSPAGDGKTILQEYQQQRNPLDYYQGAIPTVAIVSGDGQTNSSGAFLTNALVVSVKDALGNPLTNAPVAFWVSTGTGLVNTTNATTPTPVSYWQGRTDTNGYAQVYFQQPLVAGSTNGVGSAAGSSQVGFISYTPPNTNAPAAPSGLTAVSGDSNQVNLSWSNNADNATSLVIQESTNGTTWSTVATLTNATLSSYELNGLTRGVGYYFSVFAENSGGSSLSNNTSSTILPGNFTYPPSRYALIDLGSGMTAKKVTNSGYVLLQSGPIPPHSYRWTGGTLTQLQTQSPATVLFGNDIAEDGTVVGDQTGYPTNYIAHTGAFAIWSLTTWDSTSSAPSSVNFAPPAEFDLNTNGHSMWFGNAISTSTAGSTIFSSKYIPLPSPHTNQAQPCEFKNSSQLSDGSSHYVGFIAANNAGTGIIYYNNNYYLDDSTSLPSGIVPSAINNEGVIVGSTGVGGGAGAWWDGTTLHTNDLSSGVPVSVNAATTVIDGTNCPATQVLNGNTLFEMDPTTNSFNPHGDLNRLVGKNFPWSSISGNFINDSSAIAGTATRVSDGSSHGILLVPTEIAVDANRDGSIVLSNENHYGEDADGNPVDSTSQAKPFRFWLNNDDDGGAGETYGSDVVPVAFPDYTSDIVTSERDLEDWNRLWIYTRGLNQAIHDGTILVGLKWKNTSGTTPGIKITAATDTDGGTEYLQDTTAATTQMTGGTALEDATDSHTEVAPSANTADFVFPASTWTNLTESSPKTFFLFEASSRGTGQLEVVFLKSDGTTKIGEGGSVWLDLRDIKEMYEREIALPQPAIPVGTATPVTPNITATSDTTGGAFVSDPNESSTHTYVVFVHGFNQTYEQSTNFAETMFKRLWWRGYKGRFAAFRWQTYGRGTNASAIGNYNDSEYVAWHSGTALKTFVTNLPSGYAVDIAAHSMGNLVVGEALREGMSIDHYAMLHAATAACCYNNGSYAFTRTETSYPLTIPDDDPDSGTKGLCYTGWLGGIGGNPMNFYDTDDSVVGNIWGLNNYLFKPQSVLTGQYYYDPSASAGHRLIYESYIAHRYLTDDGEVKAYLDHSLTGAIGHIATPANGTTISNGSIINSNDDTSFGDEHSSEWVRTIQDSNLRTFYSTLSGSDCFNLEVNP